LAGGIRLQTIHSAKGLQAPVVFLPDTQHSNRPSQAQVLWDVTTGQAVLPHPTPQPWRTSYEQQLRAIEHANTIADAQQLLYVALTRAADYLYIGGVAQKNQAANSWYAQIQAAATLENGWQKLTDGSWQFTSGIQDKPTNVIAPKEDTVSPNRELPAWLQQQSAEPLPLQTPTLPTAAQNFGVLVHSLLENPQAVVSTDSMADLLPQARAQATAVRAAHPQIFAENSYAEVPLLDANGALKRLDRLVVWPHEVWVIDFKTDAAPSTTLPPDYAAQLAAYRQAVQVIYPNGSVRAGVVYTADASLVWLAD
jgi:ATP-dependent helicase/nuclease subunit A